MTADNAVLQLSNGEDLTKLLGRRPAPDKRDFPLRAAVPRGTDEVPSRRSWRTGPILNQMLVECPQRHTTHPACDERGFCVGAGARNFLSAEPLRTSGGPSMLDLYHLAQTMDEWDGENYAGTSVRGGMKALQRLGHIETYSRPANPTEFQTWLATKGTIIIGIDWSESMFHPDAKGFIEPGSFWLGLGHCLTVSTVDLRQGYGHDAIYGGPNSWGRHWGWNGRWRMRGKHLHDLLFGSHYGEAFAATELRLASG